MSLAAAQRNLGIQNQKRLQKAGESKMMESLGSSLGAVASMGADLIADKFNTKENKRAWESVESGAEYLGLEKDAIQKPSMWQRAFKNPSDMMGDKMFRFDSKNLDGKSEKREISMNQLKQLGTLTKSDNKEFYERATKDKGGLRGAYSDLQKTNAQLQGMDASGAYKNQTRREHSPYMGSITEESSSYDTLRKTMPSSFNEAYAAPSSILKRREGEEAGKEFSLSAPDSSPSTDPMSRMDNMDLKSVQASINQGYGIGTDSPYKTAKDAGANFYKLMMEGTSQEMGQSYFDALIDKRDLLRSDSSDLSNIGDKPIG